METDKIKAILAAVKYKTLSRAASEFSYTPSALSHMADSLEDELGVKLLVRTHKGVSLTEDGELLKQRFENVLVAENELKSAVSDLMSDKQPSLRIGTYSSISNNILPGILKSFKRASLYGKLSGDQHGNKTKCFNDYNESLRYYIRRTKNIYRNQQQKHGSRKLKKISDTLEQNIPAIQQGKYL